MKKLQLIMKILMLVAFTTIITSCIGTVKDANPKETNILNSGSAAPAISFDGLIKAEAVAHNKIELQFSPADGADDIIYEIYVNNSPIPVKVNGKSLNLNASGNYLFTVTGLQMNSTYSFNMRATVAGFASDSKLDPAKSLFATTYNNETADFLGISSLTLGAGEAGRDTIIVKWNPATITGTSINPKDSDPVQYEITYISQLGGAANLNNSSYSGPDRRVVYSPPTLNNPPALNKDKQYTISGLNPGVTYYVQIRAIHKGYVTYGSDQFYMRDKNTRFLKLMTYASAGVFDFNSTQVVMTHPLGEPGLTNLDVSWLPASGEFNHYRVCYKKVAAPNGSVPGTDLLQDSDIDAVLNNPAYCVVLNASINTYRLASLESYAYYQAKVLACRTAACATTDRIKSSLMQDRVITNIAQFSGIVKVYNPLDDTKLNEISVTFDAPVVASGYMTKMKLYCYSNQGDTSPVALPTDGTVSAGTGKAACNGIATNTPFPTSLTEFSNFTGINLQMTAPIDGTKTYCLSLVPVIESPYLNQQNLSSAVVRCFTPEIKTPTNIEFPGKNQVCSTTSGKDLSITWPTPSGGLYSKFVIFYKEKNTGTDFFSFTDAVNAYDANNALSAYKWVDNIDKALISNTIINLVPGKNYSIGILPYLVNGATKVYGQYNLNVDDCALPLPAASFQEWVDVFAVGPKEDGLTPVNGTGARRYILETLDDDGIPVELKIQSDEKTPDTTNTLAAARTSSSYLDGVYGAWNARDTNPLNQYSNSGIIKIAWKDVTFFSGSATMSDYITSQEKTPGVKNSRKYGYKVYRSEDNQTSWVDLTTVSTKNKFQSAYNAGLVHPQSFTWRARNNAAPVTEKIAFFTDYSVKFSGVNGEVDRARTYWYKIVPVFDGKEISYSSTGNLKHQMIRVTLPPRNMALVHRMMANRTICLEMDKTLNMGEGENYSCEYNGIGASGKTATPSIGSTVYDLGGDLLIDRFELSCPFTRGDSNYSNSDSSFTGSRLTFAGLATNNNPFKGCYNEKSDDFESFQGSYSPTVNFKSNQVTPGDCFGSEEVTITAAGTSACTDPTKVNQINFTYPGIKTSNEVSNCGDPSKLGENMFNMADPASQINTSVNLYFPTQSEFSAVYYMRGNWHSSYGTYLPKNIPAGSGKTLVNKVSWDMPSSCQVNFAYVNNTGAYRPRWIPVNWLFNKMGVNTSGATLSLYNKTIGQVLTDTNLYDSTSVKAPPADLVTNNRYSSTSTLARVVTSNAAKLPGMTGMSQLDYAKVCSTYQVQVGIETSTKGFVALDAVKQKRLMRKKESTVAAAWPQQYSSATVTSLENGLFTESSQYKGCNSTTRLVAPGTLLSGTFQYTKGDIILPTFPTTGKTKTFLMEGSSNLDSGNESTEKCVSRFGVQDLAGNLREVNADELQCDYTQDQLFLGVPNSVVNSFPYTGTEFFDPNSVTPWVLPQPKSGSCSVVEKGGDRTGTYVNGATFAPVFNYAGVNTAVVSQTKRFDQEAVVDTRNGDGTFLDFGQLNIGPKLDVEDSLSMTNATNSSNYFSPVLGLPLACNSGCDTNGSDNQLFTSTTIATAKGYDNTNNPLSIPMLDFPTNNGSIQNAGISEIQNVDSVDTSFPDATPVNYVASINTGALPADPLDNFFNMATLIPGTGFPNALNRYAFKVGRTTTLKFYTGGSSTTSAGRYSLYISGSSDNDERYHNNELGSRCSVMINQD